MSPRASAAFLDSTEPDEQEARAAALDAYQAATLTLEQDLAEQTSRLAKAQSVLPSPKPTKKAETDQHVAAKKFAIAKAKLAEIHDHAKGDGYARIWPGGVTPGLMRDPATGERRVVPDALPLSAAVMDCGGREEVGRHLQCPARQARHRLAGIMGQDAWCDAGSADLRPGYAERSTDS